MIWQQRLVRHRLAALAVAASGPMGCEPAFAEASIPWMPSLESRHRLQWLADEAGLALPVMQWPLPAAAVVRELDALPASLPPALQDARAALLRELAALREGEVSAALRSNGQTLAGYGDDATEGSSVAARTPAITLSGGIAQLGARLDVPAHGTDERAAKLDGSVLATEALGVQLQAWAHRSWWGPGWQSSLALSNNAPALMGVGVQRAAAGPSASPWLSWLGPWNFEVFMARADNWTQSTSPYVMGSRLTARPLELLEVGLTRMIQWGGDGRSQSLRLLVDTWFGRDSNGDRPGTPDVANQLGGIDLRLRCGWGLRCAAYTQLIGEDEAGGLPSKYLGLYGVEGWSADGSRRYFIEYANTACGGALGKDEERGCAYRNHAFSKGYASDGRWLGASIGPDSRLLTLGGIDVDAGLSLRLHVGDVGSRIARFAEADGAPRSRLVGVSARKSLQWKRLTVAPEFEWLRVNEPSRAQSNVRVGVSVSMPLND